MRAVVRSDDATEPCRSTLNRRVGWYTSGAPAGTHALNTFAEYSGLRARLMLGEKDSLVFVSNLAARSIFTLVTVRPTAQSNILHAVFVV
jgi:hypothetical protein